MPSIRLGEYCFFTTWKVFCVGLFCVSILLGLGVWQLHRGAQKKQILLSYAQQVTRKPILWDKEHPLPPAYQRIKLQGSYLYPQFLLDNQFYQHQWGYHVLSPFCLQKGGQIIMIDRGWIKGDISRQTLPQIEIPKDEHQVLGYVYYPQYNRWITQPSLPYSSAKLIIIEQFLPNIFKSVLHYPVLPFMIRPDPTAVDDMKRDWQVVTVSPERHFAYAIQWFSLAVLFCVAFVAVQLKREQHEDK